MKKIKILIFFTLIFLSGCKSKEKKMLDYMKNRYGEEFVLGFAGGRGDKLMVDTMPKRYLGTPKENDKYYHGTIFYRPYKIGDNYGAVVINEGANKYVRPKLEELFGKNILIALNLEGYYEKINFKEEMERRKALYKADPEGEYFPLSGGIYIFGRVENEKDREKYRRGIYEFIQYLKQEGMFEYALLKIRVIDERVLTKGYRNNDNNIRENLIELANDKSLNRKEYSKKRVKLMSQFDEEYNKMTDKEKEEVMESYSKAALNKSYIKVFGKGAPLLSFFSYSPKYIISQGWNKDKNSDDYEEVKYYDKIEEVDLSEGW